MARTATKTGSARKSLSDYITERFDDFSRSQKDVARYIVDHLDEAAFQTAEELARRANTSSSTVVRFSQALGFDGYPELQQAAIEEYRHKVAEGAGDSNTGSGAAALFNFDHSEFEASLGADYSNIEETARSLTREQVEASVSAIATSRRVLIVGVEQMAFFASYLRHLLGSARRPGGDRRLPEPGQHPAALANGRGDAAGGADRGPRSPAHPAGL